MTDQPLFSEQEEADTRRFIQALRDLGVTHYEGLLPLWSQPVKLVLAPPAPPPPLAADRPPSKPARTEEERLYNPLGIGKKAL